MPDLFYTRLVWEYFQAGPHTLARLDALVSWVGEVYCLSDATLEEVRTEAYQKYHARYGKEKGA